MVPLQGWWLSKKWPNCWGISQAWEWQLSQWTVSKLLFLLKSPGQTTFFIHLKTHISFKTQNSIKIVCVCVCVCVCWGREYIYKNEQ